MTGKYSIGRIFIPGGIVSPGDLRRIATTAFHFGIPFLNLGFRQQIMLRYKEKQRADLEVRFANLQYDFRSGPVKEANIVSSCPVQGIAAGRKWLSEGIYRETLASFSYTPAIEINICDPLQGMFPLFGGRLNYLASEFENYWHLYIVHPVSLVRWEWPVLIDSREIASLSFEIERILTGHPDISLPELESAIYNLKEWTFRLVTDKAVFRSRRFFYYEGIHSLGGNSYWLGIYERLNQYPVEFMEAVAMLCSQTDIGSISITPYKSIIIKNIREKDLPLWENLLGKYRINTAHSALEVNFLLPDMHQGALKLRKSIVDYFDNREVRSEGLVFALHAESIPFSDALVLIEEVSGISVMGKKFFDMYRIRYKKDFNAYETEYITFSDYIKKRDIPEVLIYLCSLYYERVRVRQEKKELPEQKEPQSPVSYSCSFCLTEYSEEYGDSFNGIIPGIPFELLSESYECPLCGASKNSFVKMPAEGGGYDH